MEFAREVLKTSVESLLKLQEIDGQLFLAKQEEGAPPADYLTTQNKLNEAVKVFKTVERVCRDLDRERRALELRSLTQQEDIKKAEAKRRDLRNTKEEFAAGKEYDNFSRRQQETKKLLDEKTAALTQKTATKDEKEKEMQTLQQAFQTLDDARKSRLAELAEKNAELLKQRDQFIAKVDDQIFSLYERVQKLRRGAGIAIVKDAICTGCHVTLPPHLRNQLEKLKELITCPSCSRILYPESELSEGSGAKGSSSGLSSSASSENPSMKLSEAAH